MSNEAPRTKEEFDAFFRASYNWAVGRLMGRDARLDSSEAQAIVSTAFHETFTHWSKVRDPRGFLWDRVAKRAIDYWRKQQATREAPYDVAEGVFVRPAPMDGEPERCMDRMYLEKLIDELPPRDQRAIRLHLDGATTRELAAALGADEVAARVCLSRARKRFAKLIEREAEVR
ncbi:sigma-70 family RNA polymerase sigma factor [Streptomyces avermitilis]|uniref:RNA polymerase sigma factor n=1 Tax=Streptomyces avermitilis TaxID=33903 RepID=UPI0033A2B141